MERGSSGESDRGNSTSGDGGGAAEVGDTARYPREKRASWRRSRKVGTTQSPNVRKEPSSTAAVCATERACIGSGATSAGDKRDVSAVRCLPLRLHESRPGRARSCLQPPTCAAPEGAQPFGRIFKGASPWVSLVTGVIGFHHFLSFLFGGREGGIKIKRVPLHLSRHCRATVLPPHAEARHGRGDTQPYRRERSAGAQRRSNNKKKAPSVPGRKQGGAVK